MATQGNDGDTVSPSLNREQIGRYADLIAAGKAKLPDGLPADQEGDLIARARALLRRRLIGMIARQVVSDLAGEGRPRSER